MITAPVGYPSSSTSRGLGWAIAQLCSFEAVFVLFLYSNEIKIALAIPTPVDETVLFGALAVAAAGWVVWREGIWLRGIPVLAAGLAFICWAVASFGWSPSRVKVYEGIAYLLTFTTFCLFAGACIVAGRRSRVVRLFAFILIVGSLMGLYGLYIYAVYGDFRRWAGWEDVEARAYLAFGHTVVNAAGIALCGVLYARFGSMRQACYAAVLGALALFLLIGGGRGPFLGLALVFLIGLVIHPPKVGHGRFELRATTLMMNVVLAVAALAIVGLIMTGDVTTTLARFVKLFSQAEDSTLVQGPNRFEYWAGAWEYWLSAPVIGHGLNSFSYLFRGGRELPGAHPHNIILQILAELGLVGLILFGTFVWVAARNISFHRLKVDPLMVCALFFVITSAMSPLFGRDLVDSRKFFFALSLLALRPPPIRPMPMQRVSTDARSSRFEALPPVGLQR